MKKYFDQQEKQKQFDQQNQQNQLDQQRNNIVPNSQPIGNVGYNNYANLRDTINQPIFNQHINTQQLYNQNLNSNLEFDNLRRKQINEQLNNMKKQVNNINLSEKSFEKKYKSSHNVVKRSGVSVDTSSTINSNESNESFQTNKSNKSNQLIDSIKSDNSNNSVIDEPQKIIPNKNNTKKVNVDKSLSSKNNASTFSKRKYKRNTISIDT
jgi:hypothetical protein